MSCVLQLAAFLSPADLAHSRRFVEAYLAPHVSLFWKREKKDIKKTGEYTFGMREKRVESAGEENTEKRKKKKKGRCRVHADDK
jgi:hypothetical protein